MSRNPPPMGFPRKWSGYLSGAVKSAKILTHLSSKNALTSNSISRNNPTSSAGDFEWLTQHVISPRESKVSIFYWERPGLPLIFRPNWGPKDQKTIFFLRPPPPPLLSQGVDDCPTPPPSPLIWRSGSATVVFNFPCPGGGGGMSLILTFRLPTWPLKS